MLKITKLSADRVDVEFSGKLDADEMRAALDDLFEASKDVSQGRLLYKIYDFSLPTLRALGIEVTRFPKLFGLLAKFDKCAVLCDKAWIRTAADVEGAIFPGIDIRSFRFDELEAAEMWLSSTTSQTA